MGIFSHYVEGDMYPYKCVGNNYKLCIPYNDDTKHLVGTTNEAPEFYRYWEDWIMDLYKFTGHFGKSKKSKFYNCPKINVKICNKKIV